MIQVLRPDWPPAAAGVQALCTLRSGGASRAPFDDGQGGGGLNLGTHVGDDPDAVARNRHSLRALLPDDPAWLDQVHGTQVVDAASVRAQPTPARADASYTVMRNLPCVILTADCLPVLFADIQGRVVGAAHAGWRGLAAGVLEATVAAMQAAGAQELHAWLGPAIGPASFEVGAEVRLAFVEQDAQAALAFESAGSPQKFLADLYMLARQRLMRSGIASVSGGAFDTVQDVDRFYSYRRDGRTGRMASLIWTAA